MSAGQVVSPHHHTHHRDARRAGLVVGAVAVGVIVAATVPTILQRQGTTPAAVTPVTPDAVVLPAIPGEFKLGPGLADPPGVVVPLPRDVAISTMPGEFKLGPGLAQPPGIVVPTVITRVPGDFVLGPGLNEPPGIVPPALGES